MGYNSDDACRRERRIVKRIDCNEKGAFIVSTLAVAAVIFTV